MKIAAYVDVRDEVCSRPVLETKVKLNQIQPGEVLEVLADSNSKDDIVRIFGKVLKHEVIGVSAENGDFRILLRKTERGR